MKDTTEIENRLIGHIINFDRGQKPHQRIVGRFVHR